MPRKGQKMSDEQKRKISLSHMGIGHSEETKKKLSIYFTKEKPPAKPCECGCGEIAAVGSRFIQGHSARCRSIETRNKLSQAQKLVDKSYLIGNQFAKGKIMTEAIKLQISESLKGRIFTEEHKQKIGNSAKGNTRCLGRIQSEETKEKMRKFMMGNKNSVGCTWRRGTTLSEATKLKIGLAGLGRVHSEATKQKMSERMLKRYQDPEELKKMFPGQTNQPNHVETMLLMILNRMFPEEYIYTGNFTLWIDGKNPDFVCHSKNTVIELFGDYWHKGESEEPRINHFGKSGWRTLIVWECELRTTGRAKLLDKLLKFHTEVES